MIEKSPVLRGTAREVLVKFAGKVHAEHSVMWRETVPARGRKSYAGAFLIGCSCGAKVAVAATEENLTSLRNVFERQS